MLIRKLLQLMAPTLDETHRTCGTHSWERTLWTWQDMERRAWSSGLLDLVVEELQRDMDCEHQRCMGPAELS